MFCRPELSWSGVILIRNFINQKDFLSLEKDLCYAELPQEC